jgi:hypothetical protein
MSHGSSRFIGQRFLVFLQQLLLERKRCGRLNGDAIAAAMVQLKGRPETQAVTILIYRPAISDSAVQIDSVRRTVAELGRYSAPP